MILDFAATEFALRGYVGASTRAIAKNADVPHTLVIYYFQNKDGLWFETARNLFTPFFDRMMEWSSSYGDDDDNAADILKLAYTDFIRFSAREPRFHRIMANEGRERSHRLEFLLSEYNNKTTGIFVKLVKKSQKDGRFIIGDPHQLVYAMVGAATTMFSVAAEFEIISGKSAFDNDVLDEHIRICLRMFFRDEV